MDRHVDTNPGKRYTMSSLREESTREVELCKWSCLVREKQTLGGNLTFGLQGMFSQQIQAQLRTVCFEAVV